jgi:hypothetical protein
LSSGSPDPNQINRSSRLLFDSIAGSKHEIENLQSLPMSDPIPEIEHLYFFLIFKDQTAFGIKPISKSSDLDINSISLGGG